MISEIFASAVFLGIGNFKFDDVIAESNTDLAYAKKMIYQLIYLQIHNDIRYLLTCAA